MSALIGASLLAGSALLSAPAQALSAEAIVDKLAQVPVFVILNGEGQPLTVAAAEGGDEAAKVPVVFIDGATAETFLAQAQEEDQSAQVALVDLGTLYQETAAAAETPVPLAYFPITDELTAAVELQSNFQGVPLFIARQGEEGPYLTITQDGQASLPMFFSRDDLQTLLDQYTASNAEAADGIVIQVLSLEWLLDTMATNDDPELDTQLNQVRLFPSTEVLDYIRAQQQSGGQPAEGQPAEGAPTEGAPTEGQPAEGVPAEGQPAEAQPAQ